MLSHDPLGVRPTFALMCTPSRSFLCFCGRPRLERSRLGTAEHRYWEKLNRGVSKPGCFPLFSGKVQIVSRTLSGLFLVGALNRARKRKRTIRENPRTIPEQIRKIPEKSGKSQKGQKRTKKEGQVQIGKPPRLKPPRLAALEGRRKICCKIRTSLRHFVAPFLSSSCFQEHYSNTYPIPKH